YARLRGMTIHLKDQVALITGGAAGIGRATALAFAAAGARVVIADIDADGGEELAQQIIRADGQARFVRCDVARDADHVAVVAFAVEAFGRLDCAFNNAGIEEEHAKLADGEE